MRKCPHEGCKGSLYPIGNWLFKCDQEGCERVYKESQPESLKTRKKL